MKNYRKIIFIAVLVIIFVGKVASANYVTEEVARNVVQNWLEMTPNESLAFEGREIMEVMHFTGGHYGNPGYYVILLDPDGWAVQCTIALKHKTRRLTTPCLFFCEPELYGGQFRFQIS